MKLLVATSNAHKLKEILTILSVPGLELMSLCDVPDVPDVVEDGETFDANARLKAGTVAKLTGMWVLADDSGLEVDALGGDPGVISARYAGEPSDDARNNAKLLASLGDSVNRSARFRCVLALSDRLGACATVEGCCEGRIARSERGVQGFGYDPLFIPDGHANTFGELQPDIKNGISHRYGALARARKAWATVLRGDLESWDAG